MKLRLILTDDGIYRNDATDYRNIIYLYDHLKFNMIYVTWKKNEIQFSKE